MGTNFYAEWNVGGGDSGPVEFITPASILRLHICKSKSTFQGRVFNSWSAWRNFLTNHECRVTIRDEYDTVHDVHEFVQSVDAIEPERRSRHYQYMVDNYTPSERTNDWKDADGYSFYNGEFS